MTRDEAITAIATTTVLDHATARRCVEAMPNVVPVVMVWAATQASILAQLGEGMTAVDICREFALELAVRQALAEQAIARMAPAARHLRLVTPS